MYSNNTMQSSTEAFRSPTLTDGQHTLTVINLDSRGVSLFLDSFIVFTDSGSTTSPSSPTTPSTSTTTNTPVIDSSSHAPSSGTTASTSITAHLPAVTMAASSTLSTISHNTSTSEASTPSASTRPSDSNQIPLIVGPIFGAILFCGILYTFFLLRRRRKGKEPKEPIANPGRPFTIFSECLLWLMNAVSFLRTNSIVGPYASRSRTEAVSLPQLKRTSSIYRGPPNFITFIYCGQAACKV